MTLTQQWEPFQWLFLFDMTFILENMWPVNHSPPPGLGCIASLHGAARTNFEIK